MDKISLLCRTASSYPSNLVDHSNIHQHVLDSYLQRLDQRQDLLFQKETETAALDFIDLREQAAGGTDNKSSKVKMEI